MMRSIPMTLFAQIYRETMGSLRQNFLLSLAVCVSIAEIRDWKEAASVLVPSEQPRNTPLSHLAGFSGVP